MTAQRSIPVTMPLDTWTAWLAHPGMVPILAAFALETRGMLHSRSTVYLSMMAIGFSLLAVGTLVASEWVFPILEVA